MAPLINLDSVSVAHGLKVLLNKVTIGVNAGERIGVVGLNGGGKSTLLAVLSQRYAPDSGRVSHTRDLRMAFVDQQADSSDATVVETIVGDVDAHEWASNATTRSVITGLGLEDILQKPTNALSGGQLRRTMLARALAQDVDLLVLDEPTNHLDIEGVTWLAEHLKSRPSACIVVTHDRWFLDTVANKTWEVHDGTVDQYDGGYNDWMFARAERQRQADTMESRRQNLARKELAWLRRGAPARTSKPRYRIAAAEALIADVPPPRNKVELLKFSASRQGKRVVDIVDATIATPDDRVLLDDFTWRLGPGQRIGLVGVNGSGKTTLLRTIAGAHPLKAGTRREGVTLKIGWLRQELEDLPGDRTVLASIEDVAQYVQWGKGEMSASQVAERLGFPPKRQRTPVKNLSGGERRRLQLTRIIMSEPNLLLLDEPTNDLDIDTLQELESMLDAWPGTLIVISHDRYLIERMCDDIFALFADGNLTHLPGGIEDYLQIRTDTGGNTNRHNHANIGAAAHSAAAHFAAQAEESANGTDTGGNNGTGADSGSSSLSAAETREITKEMRAVERKMEKLNQRDEKIQQEMAKASMDLDTEKLTKLQGELSEVKDALAEHEMNWMELAEKLE